jgi:hypothetical protein
LGVLLALSILVASIRILLELAAALPSHAFNPYGLNAIVAWIALELAVAALFVRPGARLTALSAMRSGSACRCSRRPRPKVRFGPARSRVP